MSQVQRCEAGVWRGHLEAAARAGVAGGVWTRGRHVCLVVTQRTRGQLARGGGAGAVAGHLHLRPREVVGGRHVIEDTCLQDSEHCGHVT